MPADPSDATDLCQFNREVIGQAIALVLHHLYGSQGNYDGPVGAHLRHVIEHYDALRAADADSGVDYDRRPRDRQLERCPLTALHRLLALDEWLAGSRAAALDAPVQVHGRTGLGGERAFTVVSTLGRELVFVGSHAVHHFALLKDHCHRHGIDMGTDFGKAPATLAHERLTRTAILPPGASTPPCLDRNDHVSL